MTLSLSSHWWRLAPPTSHCLLLIGYWRGSNDLTSRLHWSIDERASMIGSVGSKPLRVTTLYTPGHSPSRILFKDFLISPSPLAPSPLNRKLFQRARHKAAGNMAILPKSSFATWLFYTSSLIIFAIYS